MRWVREYEGPPTRPLRSRPGQASRPQTARRVLQYIPSETDTHIHTLLDIPSKYTVYFETQHGALPPASPPASPPNHSRGSYGGAVASGVGPVGRGSGPVGARRWVPVLFVYEGYAPQPPPTGPAEAVAGYGQLGRRGGAGQLRLLPSPPPPLSHHYFLRLWLRLRLPHFLRLPHARRSHHHFLHLRLPHARRSHLPPPKAAMPFLDTRAGAPPLLPLL